MFEVMIRTGFSAAHSLREYKGKCEDLHGHNFRVEVFVKAEGLDHTGLTIDFRTLKEKAQIIMDQLDHTYLNDFPFFTERNPSSENIAFFIFEKLKDTITDKSVSIDKVTVWESENSCASYYEK